MRPQDLDNLDARILGDSMENSQSHLDMKQANLTNANTVAAVSLQAQGAAISGVLAAGQLAGNGAAVTGLSLANLDPAGAVAGQVVGFNGSSVQWTTPAGDRIGSLGSIVSSMLTEAQFQSLNGPGWVLADERNVTGSAYHALTGNGTIPDLRGAFLRGKNNGEGGWNPDGESACADAWKRAADQATRGWDPFTGGFPSRRVMVLAIVSSKNFRNRSCRERGRK